MGALAKKQIVNLYNRQKMRTFIVILATIALCTALPSTEDEIVPEMSLIQAKEEYDAHADAVASLEFLQTTEGRSKNACESLAKDTIKEIDNSIKTQQNMLNKLYKGERCHTEGKAAYDQAKRRKTDADRKLSTANKRLRDASNYQVDFGRYTFSNGRNSLLKTPGVARSPSGGDNITSTAPTKATGLSATGTTSQAGRSSKSTAF